MDRAIDALEDLSEGIDYAIVGPRDSRVQEIRTKQFPFNTICYLGRDFGDGHISGCTGVLISPTLVVTAGHCVYNHLRGRAPKRIAVIPGRADRDTRPYGIIMSREYFAPKNFVRSRPRTSDLKDHDYGVIVLPRPVPRLHKFMALHPLSESVLNKLRQGALVTIAGYPGDRPIGTIWRHTERVKSVAPRRLHYTVDTCPGHSGSPIWFTGRDGRRLIIGIHTSGITDELGRAYGCKRGTVLAPPGMMNSGVRLIPEVLHNILNIRHKIRNTTMMKL